MTVCNMSIEAGARAGLVGARRHDLRLPGGSAPRADGRRWEEALEHWRTLPSDDDAAWDNRSRSTPRELRPARHLGHQPRPGDEHRRGGARSGLLRRAERAGRRRPGRSRTWG